MQSQHLFNRGRPRQAVVPTEIRRRVNTAAHQRAMAYENTQRVQLLAKVRDLIAEGATYDQVEIFLLELEAGQ